MVVVNEWRDRKSGFESERAFYLLAKNPSLSRCNFNLDFYAKKMDQQTPQTVAQAVQAATQGAVSQPSPPVQPVQQVPQSSSTIDNLTCQWQGCGERCDSAEALYVS